MAAPVEAILFIGIIPALLLLFIGLKGYDGYYKDKIIFLTFVVGLVFGVIAGVIRLVFNLPLIIVYIISFAFIEQLFKTIVLNIGRLQGKKETPVYGFSIGLGFGAAFTPFLIIAGGLVETETSFLLIVTFGSLGFIFFHAATGILIGYGIYIWKTFRYLLYAILIQIPFNALSDISRFYTHSYFIAFQIGLVAFGAILFWYSLTKIMPKILKQKDDN